MSTYEASASFSLRSSLPAFRITLAMPPSPSAARFFCSSTRVVTFCLMPPRIPASATEPLPVLCAPFARSVSAPVPATLEVLLLLFVGMLLLHRRERARHEPAETAGNRGLGASIRTLRAYFGRARA